MPAVLIRALAGASLVAALLPAVASAQEPAGGGQQLYAEYCARCHGSLGGGSPRGPSLVGVGEQAADFYLRTGYMPLESPEQEPTRNAPIFDERELRALIRYVASLGAGPPVPNPQPERGSIAKGQRLFTTNCAGCHQIVGAGGFLTGARVPPLESATPVQIAEAVRLGPYVMPKFDERQLSDADVDSLIAYVLYAKSPDDRGGWSLGHIGPIPEGLVTWLIGVAALVAACLVIGRRLKGTPE